MEMSGGTILITGGSSGIGRALAEALHARGNQIIVAGRRKELLLELTRAHKNIDFIELDISDAQSIRNVAEQLVRKYPSLNVLINNAGIMRAENITEGNYLNDAEETLETNLAGPIRLTAALLPHLLKQPQASILMVSSGLAFVPLAMTPTYSATKAALHSYSMSLRHQLRGTSVKVIEIVPPYVQTYLMGEHQAKDPNAMPLSQYIKETIGILSSESNASEVVVERCKPLRFSAQTGELPTLFKHLNPS